MAVRLENYLFRSDVGTYKEISEFIKNGSVNVNGAAVDDNNYRVDVSSDFVEIDGKVLNYRRYVYIMMNKPEGLSSAKFDRHYKTVIDLLPQWCTRRKMKPVNTLDIDMAGLVLITDDMGCHHSFNLQNKNTDRVYHVQTDKPVSISNVDEFAKGMKMKFYTGNVTHLSKTDSYYKDEYAVRLTSKDSTLFDIKKMFGAVGISVYSSELIAVGDLVLDPELNFSEWRELDIHELSTLHIENPYY